VSFFGSCLAPVPRRLVDSRPNTSFAVSSAIAVAGQTLTELGVVLRVVGDLRAPASRCHSRQRYQQQGQLSRLPECHAPTVGGPSPRLHGVLVTAVCGVDGHLVGILGVEQSAPDLTVLNV
jgi:hypothetical protein